MDEDKLSFLDGGKESNSAPETVTTPAPAPTSSAPSEQPRDEVGRFAAKPADAPAPAPAAAAPAPVAPTPAPAATPAPTQEPKQEAIPLATALDWRDRMTAAERRLKQLEHQPAQPRQVPSAQAEPEAYAAYLENIANETRVNTRFEMSEALAREKHGDDATQKAMDWAMEQAQTSPSFAAEYLQQRHPIDWAVKQQKRHALIAVIGDDPEAYIAAEIAKRTQAATAPQPQTATPAAAPPPQAAQPAPAAPRSIAHSPSAGASQHITPSGPGRAFDAAFQP